ncbi:MAG TPA: amidohydrolase family protein [Anaerolineales bacterium]|nr:amidohydrolase family protein [Anaerolineales bacterium]
MNKTIKFPGLIDPHVHLRDPGATHKEDFSSGTRAALAGGFTTVLAMPNTQPPLVDIPSLELAQSAAQMKAFCDYGIYLGAGPENRETASRLAARVCGLKLYLDQTYGPLRLENMMHLYTHVSNWPSDRPLAAHAEGPSLAAILFFAALLERSVHICHVSRRDEILLIRAAKEKGLQVTCEVTPHHLFLTEADAPRIGPGRSEVRPRLASASDQDALWKNLDVIDCFATDHAPHTLEEKDGPQPPPGFPGLETALGLFLGAVNDGRLTHEELIARMHTNPKRIFALPGQSETSIEVDLNEEWEVCAADLQSQCGWSPFEGMRLKGRVRRVVLRGQCVYADGQVLAAPGFGRDIREG